MITVGMNYEVLEGKGQIFEDSFRGVLKVMSAMPGHVRSRLFKDIDSPGSYLIHSEWDSKEAFTAFIRSKEFADVTRWGAQEILAGRPSHKIYGE
ncbi:MAG TPA: antibiotic biosynthesis monooxygenase family protein [Patescibacteria group bacterium]|jgi:heme-degrading monooxygenase HmoA|nr:antibiotic biosynthesis monooxygenase family protein [Patescibacteria group bacterium]